MLSNSGQYRVGDSLNAIPRFEIPLPIPSGHQFILRKTFRGERNRRPSGDVSEGCGDIRRGEVVIILGKMLAVKEVALYGRVGSVFILSGKTFS